MTKPVTKLKTFWTEDRVSELERLWANDLTASQIAAEMRTTRNSVLGKVHRLGLAARKDEVSRAPSFSTRKVRDQASFASGKVQRGGKTRWHEGMKTMRLREINRFAQQMTKSQLRAELAEAVRNTAAMPVE